MTKGHPRNLVGRRGPTTAEVPPGLPYHQLARNDAHRWWRPLVGTAGILGTAAIAGAVVGVGGFLLGLETVGNAATSILALLVLSVAIFGMAKYAQKRPPGTLASVAGRLRGDWLGLCVALFFPVGMALVGFMLLFDAARGGTPLEGPPPELFHSLVPLIAVVAVQELVFRGWILQAVGAYLLQTPWPAILVSAALSTCAYEYAGAGWLTPFAFGVIAGWVTVRTGGLEASLALAWVYLAGVFGLGLTTEPDDVWQVGAHIGAMLLFGVAAVLLARVVHIPTVTIPA